ncbi:MAG: cystathionine beta-lyase, partial [Deltaproteobacteria bacterium]
MEKTSTSLINSGFSGDRDELGRYHTINPPLTPASTILFESYAELASVGRGEYEGLAYGTDGSPVQLAFEQAMTELVGGYFTRAFPSGLLA